MAQEEIWEIILTKPASKAYEKASGSVRKRIDQCFEELEFQPLSGPNIRFLTGHLKGLCRYRVGDWRVIYRVSEPKRIVEIIAILPRGSAY